MRESHASRAVESMRTLRSSVMNARAAALKGVRRKGASWMRTIFWLEIAGATETTTKSRRCYSVLRADRPSCPANWPGLPTPGTNGAFDERLFTRLEVRGGDR